MARILLSFCQAPIQCNCNAFICYYESIISELKDSGNEVMILNVAYFKKEGNWLGPVTEQIKYLKETVLDFNPELIITFNHQIFDEIYDITECPILIWDADSYEFFANKNLLSKNLDRSFLITSFEYLVDKYHEEIGIKKNRIFVIPNATGIQKQNIPYTKNISFIGSLFYYNKMRDQNKDRELYRAYINFLNGNHYDYQKFVSPKIKGKVDFNTLLDIRVVTLVHLLDLDLHLYGTERWEEVEEYIPQLAYAYHKELIFSLQQNSEVYNSSKVCISISHPQTIGIAFPWRCFDIMASNGCLISQYSKELKESTKKLVDIPMFRTPIEARELCIKLLKDDIWRREIVAASQEYIEKNARWRHRFRQIEEIFGIPLLLNETEPKVIEPKVIEPKVNKFFERLGYLIEVKLDTPKKKNRLASSKNNEPKDSFHFRAKIWGNKRIDVKIKKVQE